MAIAKKPTKAETEVEEPKQTAPAEEPTAKAEAPKKEKSATAAMIKVTNKAKTTLRQTSTGIRVEPGETVEVKDDSWVSLQEQANLLERV